MRLVIWIIKVPFKILRFIFKKSMDGEEFEYYIAKLLKKNGFKDIQMTKKSHDFGIDILAKKKGISYAFQCKYYSKPVGVAALQQAYSGCVYYGYDIPVVVTNQTFTRQAMALSKANGVCLWDGEKVKQLKRRGRMRGLFVHKDSVEIHVYERLGHLLWDEGFASQDLLMDDLGLSEEKASYLIEELQYYDMLSVADEYGVCDLLCDSYEELQEVLDQIGG